MSGDYHLDRHQTINMELEILSNINMICNLSFKLDNNINIIFD